MSEQLAIYWTTEKRKLGDLIKWEPNPRQITKEQAQQLENSINEFGYSQLYEIEPDNTLLDGHQRDEIMLRMSEFGPAAEIEVRVASRQLSLQERKKYIALKHKGAQGEWDWDALLNLYDTVELLDWGFEQHELLEHGFQVELDAEDISGGVVVDPAAAPRIIIEFNTDEQIAEFLFDFGVDHTYGKEKYRIEELTHG